MSVAIKISHALKKFGDTVVIPDFSLEVREGEFFTLLGASGCGKTTLLRMIAGFNSIEGGDFCFNDKWINDIPPYKRNIGMVFQNYAIFPHMSAWKNVAFGLKQKKIPKSEIIRRVDETLEIVRIKELWNRMPHNMSGGQQQRIALDRAIVIQPDVLLMDEPLSNLDAKLRIEMRQAIKEIQSKFKITTIYVTHDQEEALAISDRIAVMKDGTIQQVGDPVDIYQHPENLFVAAFIGQSNILDGKIAVQEGKYFLRLNTGPSGGLDEISCPVPGLRPGVKDGTAVKVCVRPNEFVIGEKGFPAEVRSRVFFGVTMQYIFHLANGQDLVVTNDIHAPIVDVGSRVDLSFNSRIVNIFDAEKGVSLMKNGAGHE
jgi:iron(III) transport system ATP-binding protein